MTLADLAWAIEDVRRRLPGYKLAAQYDRGEHRLAFATDKYQSTFGDLFREFADNFCDDVVDGITDRLQINGWTVNGDDKALEAAVAQLWTANRGESRIGGIHRNAFREGDGFAMVQADATHKARFWRQRPEQMAVRYDQDSPDVLELAAKVWRQGGRYRANLYYQDGLVERYATKGTGVEGSLPLPASFKPLDPGDADLAKAGAETYADDSGDSIPVYHYPNGEVSEYGRSLIEKVIPLQDALNKSVTDMLVAMEFHAYPQRWATGVEVVRDLVTGKEIQPFQAGEGRVWRIQNKDAKFGQFQSAELDGFLNVQDGFRLEIARKGYLAPNSVTLRTGGQAVPSGVALLVLDGRAIKLAKDRQRDWGWQHRAMMAHGLRLEGRSDVTAQDLALEWAPAETRDEAAFWEIATLKRGLGVPVSQILAEAGYDPETVAKFLDDQEAEQEASALARETLAGGRTSSVTTGQAAALGIPSAPVGGSGALAS